MNIHKILGVIIKPFRQRRMAKFIKIINPKETDRILDVGGTIYNWQLMNYRGKVTLVNLTLPDEPAQTDNFSFVIGDGSALTYSDNEFDIVFSNSVIEHVGTPQKQQDFAREILRVGKKVWLQTPAKEFFFEPHYITPFIHWLPPKYQKKLLRNFSVWGLMTRPDQNYIDEFVDQTRLLTFKEINKLFPGCEIIKEKFLFMTKAYIVIRR